MTFILCLSSPHNCRRVCMCVCVGCGPNCHYSSCRHDEPMILYVCPFIYYAQDSSFTIQGRGGNQLFIFSPCFFSACHSSESQNSPLLNTYTEHLTCKQPSIKHVQHTLTYQISCLDLCRSNQSPLCIISVLKKDAHTHHYQLGSALIRPNELYTANL